MIAVVGAHDAHVRDIEFLRDRGEFAGAVGDLLERDYVRSALSGHPRTLVVAALRAGKHVMGEVPTVFTIEEGRALYKRRVAPELYPKNFYDRALVDILIKAKGHIKSKIW